MDVKKQVDAALAQLKAFVPRRAKDIKHHERKHTPLRPDPQLYFDSMSDEQRVVMLQTGQFPPAYFVTPLFGLLAKWWTGLDKVTQGVLSDKAVNGFYVEAPPQAQAFVDELIAARNKPHEADVVTTSETAVGGTTEVGHVEEAKSIDDPLGQDDDFIAASETPPRKIVLVKRPTPVTEQGQEEQGYPDFTESGMPLG
jgi:hypothetical protein